MFPFLNLLKETFMPSRFRIDIQFFLFSLLAFVVLSGNFGCSAKWSDKPLFPPRTDTIPGILTPAERIMMIRLKGENGRRGDVKLKGEMLEQLVEEYVNSPDTVIRQEVVTAAAKLYISFREEDGLNTSALPEAFDLIKYAAMRDEDPFVRREACRVIAGMNREESGSVLRHVVRNDLDKDVQLQATQSLAAFPCQDTTETLGNLLDHRQPALRYEAMQSLKVCTKQDFGNDVSRWKQYLNGETPTPDYAPTLAERLRLSQLPMIN